MKSNLKNWRSVVAMVGIIVGLAIVPLPGADGQQNGVNKVAFEKKYGIDE
jgi:hypothetical protein